MHGLKLRYWRDTRVMTQEELAAQAGVSVDTISRIENGRRAHVRTVRALAKALRVQPEKLVDESRRRPDSARYMIISR